MTTVDARTFSHDVGRFQACVSIYSRLYSLYYKYQLVAIVGTSLVFSLILQILVPFVPSQLLSSLAVKASSNSEWTTDFLPWPPGTPLLMSSHQVPAGTWQHCTCPQGSGRNSYQALCIESGEFWRVLGRSHVRRHWKRDIVDTFTHHICTNGHSGTIGPSFPYIRRVWRWHSPQCNIIVLSLVYCWLYSLYTLHNAQHL